MIIAPIEATTSATAADEIHFRWIWDRADATRNAVTTQSGDSHRQGNSTKRISGKVSYRIMLGGNIMKVDMAARAANERQTHGSSCRSWRARIAAMTVAATRKTAMYDSPRLKVTY